LLKGIREKFNVVDKKHIETVSCSKFQLQLPTAPIDSLGTWPMSLTKDHLIEAIAKENGFPKKQSTEIVETLINIIKSSLASGDDVLVSGFGKFCVKEKRARRGRNPATGEDMMLAPRRVVTFHCSGKLRKKINQ